MPRCAARVALLVVLLVACGSNGEAPPYVVLRIEDPNGVAASSPGVPVALELTDASGHRSRFEGLPHGFPLTVTVTSERRGAQDVTIDLFAGTTLAARGTTTIDVVAQNKQVVVVALSVMCSFDPDSCPPVVPGPETCTRNSDCDDALFCNGSETCGEDGVCHSGVRPCITDPAGCAVSVCREISDSCESVPNHEACPETQICDVALGCQPTTGGCVVSQDCDDNLACNGTETCINGGCVPAKLPAPNPCLHVVCDQTSDGTDVELVPDGTSCPRAGRGAGVCFAGDCVDATVDPTADPTCFDFIRMDVFADGSIVGGTGHGLTVNDVSFPQADAGGFNPQWIMTDHDLRPADPGSVAATYGYTLSILAPSQLAKFRIRTQAGVRCQFSTTPATTTGANLVTATSFATVKVETAPFGGPDPQLIRFNFTCDAGGLAGLRVDDFCLIQRP